MDQPTWLKGNIPLKRFEEQFGLEWFGNNNITYNLAGMWRDGLITEAEAIERLTWHYRVPA